jgi:hypothetical protein
MITIKGAKLLPDQTSCPNKPFESWISVARDCKSILRNGAGKGAETSDKAESVNRPNETACISSNDHGIYSLENHHKKPK